MVLDCRRVNQEFRRPPSPELSAAETFPQLRSEHDVPSYTAGGDIHTLLYQCGVEPELAVFFGFDRITRASALEMGASTDVFDASLVGDFVYLVLKVLPTGWLWPFWIIQRMREEMIEKAGFGG